MKSPCEALVIGYRPDLVAAESLNIGVLLACPERHFLRAVFVSSFRRITAAFPYADDVLLRSIAKSIEDGCVSEAVASGTSSLNTAEAVFRRLVPDTAGAIHIHRSITGITADPARTLREIFERHVEAAVDHTQAWEEEVFRRLEAAERGEGAARDWDAVRRELRAKYAHGGPPRAELASGPVAPASWASNATASAADALTEEELLASVLAGAPERIRAAVGRLTAMGVLGEDGKLLTQELPQDMRADSQTTVED